MGLNTVVIKKNIKSFLNTMPYIKGLYEEKLNYKKNACFAPGHFYSPIVNVDEVVNNESKIWEAITKDEIFEVNLNSQKQKEFVLEIEKFYDIIPFNNVKEDNLRYYFENDYFRYTDVIFLFGIINHLKPNKIIEIGSGHSSALMLDTNSLFFKNKIQLNFIEPYPERLNSLLSGFENNCKIIEKKVQEVALDFFRELEKGDILFIDSSHVSKCGSDLNYLLFSVLPILNKGVFIHFHDIFFPFEYPKEWVIGGRNWNENYLIRAFLMNNKNYEICLFSHYLHIHHPDIFQNMPLAKKDFGGSLWLEKK